MAARAEDEGPRLYNLKEAAAYLGLDRQGRAQPEESVRWLCRTGKLKYTKVGRYIRIRQEWLDAMIDGNAILRPPSVGGAPSPLPRKEG